MGKSTLIVVGCDTFEQNASVFKKGNKEMRIGASNINTTRFLEILGDYDEYFYPSLPEWIKNELQMRDLYFETRNPTTWEMKETEIDALEHRISLNELTSNDLIELYTRKRNN